MYIDVEYKDQINVVFSVISHLQECQQVMKAHETEQKEAIGHSTGI